LWKLYKVAEGRKTMKIKYVEELVGITKKNIRFYEEQGLLSPGRADNGYREYSDGDVKRLKQIKFLRKLYVPVEEIRMVLNGGISLEDCLGRHLRELGRRQKDLTEIRSITEMLLAESRQGSGLSLDDIDIDSRLENIARLEKEGRQFMDIDLNDVHRKKTLGAALGLVLMIAFMGLLAGMMYWANTEDPLPLPFFAALMAVPVIIIVCVIAAFMQRVKEIKGGEEDEAAKY